MPETYTNGGYALTDARIGLLRLPQPSNLGHTNPLQQAGTSRTVVLPIISVMAPY